MNIRVADINDAEDIANVHVKVWQSAYNGIMPKKYLAALSVKEKKGAWSKSLLEKNPGTTLVIEEKNKVIGFFVFGPARDNDLKNCNAGELVALNILPNQWGKGHGSKAIHFVLEKSTIKKWDAVYLWVLKQNKRAISIYEAHGFMKQEKERFDTKLTGHELHEIRYTINLKQN